jgi:hypothetical protein
VCSHSRLGGCVCLAGGGGEGARQALHQTGMRLWTTSGECVCRRGGGEGGGGSVCVWRGEGGTRQASLQTGMRHWTTSGVGKWCV